MHQIDFSELNTIGLRRGYTIGSFLCPDNYVQEPGDRWRLPARSLEWLSDWLAQSCDA